jgi:uncharacterized DUF497 family protein
MEFEFDSAKSESNRDKHGIDFVEAQLLWQDADRIQIPARTQGEPRFMWIGRIGATHWSAIFTFRGEKVSIISARRSREKEVEQYEE